MLGAWRLGFDFLETIQMVSFELAGLWPLNNPNYPLDWSVQYNKLAISS